MIHKFFNSRRAFKKFVGAFGHHWVIQRWRIRMLPLVALGVGVMLCSFRSMMRHEC
jgi:ABC-type uncharacterized transport system permease subunit